MRRIVKARRHTANLFFFFFSPSLFSQEFATPSTSLLLSEGKKQPLSLPTLRSENFLQLNGSKKVGPESYVIFIPVHKFDSVVLHAVTDGPRAFYLYAQLTCNTFQIILTNCYIRYIGLIICWHKARLSK